MPPTRTQHPSQLYPSLPYSRQHGRQHRILPEHDEQYIFHQTAPMHTDRGSNPSRAVDANAFAPQLMKDGAFVFHDPVQNPDPVVIHCMPQLPESRPWRPSPVARGDREEEPLLFYAPVCEHPILDNTGRELYVSIGVESLRGFFRGDDEEWTCYRRNYFVISAAWGAANDDGTEIKAHDPHHVYDPDNQRYYQVVKFTVNITARVSDNPLQPIPLVQHTPKRDKGPVNTPTYIPLGPTPLWQIRYGASRFSPGSSAQAVAQASQTTLFDRLQFKKATANNGKRRAAQQHYEIEISLSAGFKDAIGQTRYIKIASRRSHRIVVRGRSPGHYHKDRLNEKEDNRFSDGRSLHQGLLQHPYTTAPNLSMRAEYPYTDGNGYPHMFNHPQISSSAAQEVASESTEDENEDRLSNARASSPQNVESDEEDGYRFYPDPKANDPKAVDGATRLATPMGSLNLSRAQNPPKEQSDFTGRSETGPFDTDPLGQYPRTNFAEPESLQSCHFAAMTPIRSAYADIDSAALADYGLQPPMPTAG